MPMFIIFIIHGVGEAKNGVLTKPLGDEESRDHRKAYTQEQKQQPLASPNLPYLGTKVA